VQCHQPGGNALGNWDARPWLTMAQANLVNGPLVNDGGDPQARLAVPGDPTRSMLLKRIQGSGVPRMPPLATSVIDQESVQLLTDWINQELPQRQTFSDWQIQYFGSTSNPQAAPGADPDGDGANNTLEFLTRTHPLTPGGTWKLSQQVSDTSVQIQFPRPANRSVIIETSTDLQNWAPWDVPGNAPTLSSLVENITLNGFREDDRRFYRARIQEP
jgi:hypothetical protein